MYAPSARAARSLRRPRRPGALALTALLALTAAGCDDGDPGEDPALDAGLDGAIDPDLDPPDSAPEPVDMAAPDAAPPDMDQPDAAPPPGRFERVDLCIERVLAGVPATGAAVAIVEGGALVHASGIGHRNDDAQTPVEPTTLFRFGSTLKGMTALAMFTEIEAGAVTADTPLAEVLPAVGEHADPRWQAVTLRHLLTHQGGFTDYIALQGPDVPDSDLQFVESEAFAEQAFFMVDPGTFYNYSNPNFMLAGRALEVLAEDGYRAVMRQRVFEPLGMLRTMFLADDVLGDGDYAAGVTAGPIPGTTRRVLADEYDSAWGRPAGLGWSSVVDLARYAQYVIDGTTPGDAMADALPFAAPVSPDTWATWRSAQVDAESFVVINRYAHGLVHFEGFRLGMDYFAPRAIGHGGNITGYTSVMLTVPEMNIGASVLANGDALNAELEGCLAIALATSDELPAPSPLPDNGPEPATFDDYVGEYTGGPNVGPMIVTRGDDGGLDLTLPLVEDAGIPYMPRLVPIARDMFVFGVQGLQVALSGIREAPGEPVKYLRTRFFVGQRADEEQPMDPMDPMEDGMQKRRRAIDVGRLREQLDRAALLAEPAPITAYPLR